MNIEVLQIPPTVPMSEYPKLPTGSDAQIGIFFHDQGGQRPSPLLPCSRKADRDAEKDKVTFHSSLSGKSSHFQGDSSRVQNNYGQWLLSLRGKTRQVLPLPTGLRDIWIESSWESYWSTWVGQSLKAVMVSPRLPEKLGAIKATKPKSVQDRIWSPWIPGWGLGGAQVSPLCAFKKNEYINGK